MVTGLGVVLSLTGFGLLNGCSRDSDSPAEADLTVVVNVFPLRWLVEEIGADLVHVQMIEAEHHEEVLSDEDRELINGADANLFAGNLSEELRKELESWRAGRTDGASVVVDVSEVSGLELLPGPRDLGEELLPDNLDPHFWMDPLRMKVAADWVTSHLVSAVLSHDQLQQEIEELQPLLESRNTEVQRRLDQLDEDLKATLSGCRGRTIVPEHPAFMYFAEAYGMEQFPVTGVFREDVPQDEVTRRLTELDERFQQEPRPAFFYNIDTEKIDKGRERLAELASTYGEIPDYLDSLEDEPVISNEDQEKITDYDEAMRLNARNVARELRCQTTGGG